MRVAAGVCVCVLVSLCECVPKGNYGNVLDSAQPDPFHSISIHRRRRQNLKLCIQDRDIIE